MQGLAPNFLDALAVSLCITFSGGVFLYISLMNLMRTHDASTGTLGFRQEFLLLSGGVFLPLLSEVTLGHWSR